MKEFICAIINNKHVIGIELEPLDNDTIKFHLQTNLL